MGKHKKMLEEILDRIKELENRERDRHRRRDDDRSRRSRTRRSRTRSSRYSNRSRSRSPCRLLVSPEPTVHSDPTTPSGDNSVNEEGGTNIEEVTVPQSENPVPINIEELLGNEGVSLTSNSFELHTSLLKRWIAILQDGLSVDTRTNIMKKYDPPSNCNLLIPPKLNEEVKAALNENGIKRDKRISDQQLVLSAAITSIGKTLNNMIAEQGSSNHIETLSDSARLLCGLYHDQSTTRRALILPGLNKDIKELKETPISEYLFGDKFQEKVNAIKAVKKSGQELKSTPVTSKHTPKNKTLNYRGPPQLQVQRVSGQKQKQKRPAHATKTATKMRRSPQRHHQSRRRGQDRR